MSLAGWPEAGGFDPVAERSHTLPSHWYWDPDIWRLEHEAIFYRSWWYMGHVSDLERRGDYITGRVADQGFVILRGHDGVLRAFHNVCSHRAHPLLEGCGNTAFITCPYHQWSYGTDGRFRHARGRHALKDWLPGNADLKPVRLEDYGGLLFVNPDADARPLAEQAGGFLEDMRRACPQFRDLVRVCRWEIDVQANWKTVIDNNHECYHCDANHPSLMELVDYDGKARWSDDGITFSHRIGRKDLDNGAYRLEADEVRQEALFGYIWPTHIPLMYPGSPHLAMFQVLPTGPETTRERWDFYFASREPTALEERFMAYVRDVLVKEDVTLCENVQRGLHSLGYSQGRFVVDRGHPEYSEHHVHFFQKMVFDALTRSGGPPPGRRRPRGRPGCSM